MKCRIILIFFIFLISCPFFSFGATFYNDDSNYSQDPSYIIKTDYDNKSYYFIKLLEQTKNVNSENYNNLVNLIYNRQFVYIQPISTSVWRAYSINGMSNTTINTHYSLGSYTNIPCESYDHLSNYYYEIGWTSSTGYVFDRVQTVTHQYIPLPIDLYTNQDLYNYCNSVINGDTTTVIGILNNIDSKIATTNNKLDELNETLSDEDDSDINYGVDTPTIDSSSSDNAFNGIFTMFYNALTATNSSFIDFPVPFSNGQSIRINSN